MPEIEQPKFDELATGTLSDLDEIGEAILDEAHYRGVAKLGTTTGTYYRSLRKMGVSKNHALKLTREWMHICSWGDA